MKTIRRILSNALTIKWKSCIIIIVNINNNGELHIIYHYFESNAINKYNKLAQLQRTFLTQLQ